jgi:hypothetical protein
VSSIHVEEDNPLSMAEGYPLPTSTLMVADYERTGTRIMEHPRNKHSGEPPPTRDSINTTKGAD